MASCMAALATSLLGWLLKSETSSANMARSLEGQNDGDLPDLGRLPGGEAEVENI